MNEHFGICGHLVYTNLYGSYRGFKKRMIPCACVGHTESNCK